MSEVSFKHALRKLKFPACAKESLVRIEAIVLSRGKQDFAIELIAEFVFLEKGPDFSDGRKAFTPIYTMTSIEVFQLDIILCEFFARPGPDAMRNAVFLSLFGGNINSIRTNVLVKLVSTSVSGSIAPLLSAAGAWMHQLGCTSMPSTELAQNLVRDFVTFSKKVSEQLRQLPLVAPRFAANFMTAVSDLYMNDLKGELILPPEMLLEVFTEWVSENSSLCLASLQPLALPTGAIAMAVITPLGGLIRWSVLAPILNQKTAYSKLHLSLLETLVQIPPSNGPPTALNAQHLAVIASTLKTHANKLINENINPEIDENLQCSIERLAQSVQVSLSSKCLYGSVPQLLCILETLPSNNLLRIVIKANKSL